jgi:hypothetical protein
MKWQFSNAASVEVTQLDQDRFTFATNGTDDHIRLVMELPATASDQSLDLAFDLEIAVDAGAVTHLELVNSGGSESRMINIMPEAAKVSLYGIDGIFRSSPGHAQIVLFTNGPSRGEIALTRTSATPLSVPDKIRILFYIEPWIERNDPYWKQNYVPWFSEQIRVLRQASATYDFVIAGNEAIRFASGPMDTPFAAFTQEALLEIFASSRSALTAWCNGTAPASAVKAMQELVAQTLDGFVPDIIIATAPAPYLRTLYPEALLLTYDGLHFRPPWPDSTPMLDPFGHLHGTAIQEMAEATAAEPAEDPTAIAFMDRYRAIIDRDSTALHAFAAEKIASLRQSFDKVVILALQDLLHFNIFSLHPYGTQIDYVIDVMRAVDPRTAVLLIQHPDSKDLQPQALAWLASKYKNLISDSDINKLKAPSQALMSQVDAAITTSSGLVYLAAMRHKPIFLTHSSHFSALAHTRPLSILNSSTSLAVDHARTDAQMAWILRHHAFGHAFMLHTSWLHDRLVRLLTAKRAGTLSWKILPRIGADATILDWLALHRRPGIDARPPVAASTCFRLAP